MSLVMGPCVFLLWLIQVFLGGISGVSWLSGAISLIYDVGVVLFVMVGLVDSMAVS